MRRFLVARSRSRSIGARRLRQHRLVEELPDCHDDHRAALFAELGKAGPTPSVSAKMVCEAEARRDIAATLGVKATRVTKPTWVVKDHLYSCTYVYPRGQVVLFVKEFSDEQATTAYYDSVLKHFGTIQPLKGLGQGAWTLKNKDIVARKDYKVLLVDVRGIAPPFGPSRMTRTDVALNVAAAIMSCWSGA